MEEFESLMTEEEREVRATDSWLLYACVRMWFEVPLFQISTSFYCRACYRSLSCRK
jgi:hypothetical protein